MSSPSQVPMLVAAPGTESPDDSLEEILTNELLPKDDPLNSSGNSSDQELLRKESGERKPPVVLDTVHVNVDLGLRRGGHGHSSKPGLTEDGESTSRSDTLDSAVGSFADDSDMVIKDSIASSDLVVGEKFSPNVERKDSRLMASSPPNEPAVLEVGHIACDTPSTLVKTQPADEENVSEEKKSLQRRLASLQRQSKMDETSKDSFSEAANSPEGKNQGTHVVDVEVKIRGMNSAVRPKPKLKSSASLAASSPPVSDSRSKLGKQDQRWWSLEIPSIRVRSDDDPPDDPAQNISSRKRHFSADEAANSVSSSNASLQVNYDTESVAETIRTEASNLSPEENNKRPPYLDTFQGNLPMNYAQRRLLTKSVGRTSGSKLQGSYSLDVPDIRGIQPSHSLGTLDQNTQNQKQQFQVVEDKLISSSLTRLETPGGRRLSWTPDYRRRSSKGSVQGKEDDDSFPLKPARLKDPDLPELNIIEKSVEHYYHAGKMNPPAFAYRKTTPE